jgi:hypothetical protein
VEDVAVAQGRGGGVCDEAGGFLSETGVMDVPLEPLPREETAVEEADHECEPSLPTAGEGRATGFCYDDRMCLHEVGTAYR